ncbi:response regulator transcription factor [Terrisporobacter sp.]
MRILVIEDEYSLADAMRESLKRENYMVDISYEGNSGLDMALSGIYDIIILDLMLPNLNGLDILKCIRKEKISSYVIILTAKGELDDKIKGLDYGSDDYMTKPFHIRELLARVRAVSRRNGDIDDYTLSFADLKLNLKSCDIININNNESIILSGKEFALMEFLFRNKKQVVNREQIAERIWGYDDNSQYNNVEVYISFLRKKIKFLESNVKIKAIRGIGYMMEGIDD